MTIARTDITGVVLAGGQGRRMGGVDKGLRRAATASRWSRTCIERLAPQVGEILINANQNRDRYARFGYPVVADVIGGFAGPLAGLHARMAAATHAARRHVPVRFAVPAGRSRRAACARRSTASTPTSRSRGRSTSRIRCSRWCARDVRPHLEAFLRGGGRKIDAWYATLRVVEVRFDDEADAFRNINTARSSRRAAIPRRQAR